MSTEQPPPTLATPSKTAPCPEAELSPPAYAGLYRGKEFKLEGIRYRVRKVTAKDVIIRRVPR